MPNDARKFLGKIGVWSPTDNLDAAQLRDFARKLEGWGYGALWQPEAVGRDPFATIAYLASQTERLTFATGIANIYACDATTMRRSRAARNPGTRCSVALAFGAAGRAMRQKLLPVIRSAGERCHHDQ